MTDPFINTLRINRKYSGPSTSGERFTNSLQRESGAEVPQVVTSWAKPRAGSINLDLLRTNRLIHDEAIPILYRSVRFHPRSLEGIFPIFLESLSPLAQSNIRYVKLSLPRSFSFPSSYLYWALTCAQIARLSGPLRQVEIEGAWPLPATGRTTRSCLHPLLKIDAPKKFSAEHDDEFQKMLEQARGELSAKAPKRKAMTAADSTERAKRETSMRVQRAEVSKKKPRLQDFTITENNVGIILPPPIDENRIAEDLSAIAGIANFQNDLEQWEMVERQHETALQALRKRTASMLDNDSWTDAASTVIANDEEDNVKDKDWEFVDPPSD